MKDRIILNKFRLVGALLMGTGLVFILCLSLGLNAASGMLAPPVALNWYPASSSHDATVTTPISITYNQDMDPETVNPQTFAVHARQTGWLTQTLSVEGGMIMLQPTDSLHAGELVQVSATTGTLSTEGLAPLEPTVWQFNIAPWSGRGYFVENQVLPNVGGRYAALGDLDDDSDLDAVAVSCGRVTHVYSNDSTGVFTGTQSFAHSEYCFLDVDLGDLDEDGDLDALLTDYSLPGENLLLINDGTGYFSTLAAFPSYLDTYADLGDVDGDGDLDVFIASGGFGTGFLRVWGNDGNASFALVDVLDSSYEHGGVALGDLDNDGDLDAFSAGWYDTYNKVWTNDNGFFSESQVITGTNTYYPLLGDLDNDGDLDAYLSNGVYENDNPDEIWFNDGTGYFFDSGQRLETSYSAIPALGDMDADGDLDLYASGGWGSPLPDEVWLNQGTGTGTFVLFHTVDENNAGGMVVLGDLEGDGSLDAFVSSQYTQYGYQVYLNIEWSQATPLENETGGYGFAQCPNDPNSFYIFGGLDDDYPPMGYLTTALRYDAGMDEWHTLQDLPFELITPSAVCYDHKIYLVGGDGAKPFLNTLLIYDIATDSYTFGALVPRVVGGAALGAWDGKLYLVGGTSTSAPMGLDPVNRVDIYDINTDSWTTMPGLPMPVATSFPGYAQASQYLYLVGGYSGDFTENITATQRLDLSTLQWELGPEFTTAVAGSSLTITEHRLYAIGGNANGGDWQDSTDYVGVLDLAAWPEGSWQDFIDMLPELSQGNLSNACTDIPTGAKIWSVGGVDGNPWPWNVHDTNLYHLIDDYCAQLIVNLPDDPLVGEGGLGQSVEYTLLITNTGRITDTYRLALSSAWQYTINPTGPYTIGPGKSTLVVVALFIPTDYQPGGQELSIATVTSLRDPAVMDTLQLITNVWHRMLMPLALKN